MKEGWTYKKLGEVCDILNGFAFKSNKYVDDGIRIMRITNVQKGYVIDNDPKFYPRDEENNIKQYILKENDLLLSLTGNVGRVGLLQKEMLPAALNQRVACIRANDNQLLLKFLFHKLNSDNFERDCILNATGVAQKNMSTEWLKKVLIPIPAISEQQQIVSELDLLSGIIEKQKAQIDGLDKLAQSIFYNMFGDPVTNEKGWKTEKMGIVAPMSEYKGDIADTKGSYWLLNLDMVKSNSGEIIDKIMLQLSDIGSSTIKFDETNVLYSKLRPYLNKVVLPKEKGFATSELIPLKPNISILDRIFLVYLLRSNEFVEYISEQVQGAKMPRVSMKEFRSYPVILPPLSFQQEFAAKIEEIEALKAKIRQSLKESEQLFKSRMDFYFN